MVRAAWVESAAMSAKTVWVSVTAAIAGLAVLLSNLANSQTAYQKLMGAGDLALKLSDLSTDYFAPRNLYFIKVTVNKAFDVTAKHCFLRLDQYLPDSEKAEFQKPFEIERGTTQVWIVRMFVMQDDLVGRDAKLFVNCDGAMSNGLSMKIE
jgi:hypothetical protein